MELLLPHLDGTLMNQVNNVKTDGETNKQTIVAHTFPPYRHRFHKWLEPQRSAGLQNVYLDPSYLVLGTQHNPSPPLPNFREHLYGVVRCISCPLTSLSREKHGRLQIGKKIWAASSREGEPKYLHEKKLSHVKGLPYPPWQDNSPFRESRTPRRVRHLYVNGRLSFSKE